MKRETILPHHSQTQGTFRKWLYFFHICSWESTVTAEKNDQNHYSPNYIFF